MFYRSRWLAFFLICSQMVAGGVENNTRFLLAPKNQVVDSYFIPTPKQQELARHLVDLVDFLLPFIESQVEMPLKEFAFLKIFGQDNLLQLKKILKSSLEKHTPCLKKITFTFSEKDKITLNVFTKAMQSMVNQGLVDVIYLDSLILADFNKKGAQTFQLSGKEALTAADLFISKQGEGSAFTQKDYLKQTHNLKQLIKLLNQVIEAIQKDTFRYSGLDRTLSRQLQACVSTDFKSFNSIHYVIAQSVSQYIDHLNRKAKNDYNAILNTNQAKQDIITRLRKAIRQISLEEIIVDQKYFSSAIDYFNLTEFTNERPATITQIQIDLPALLNQATHSYEQLVKNTAFTITQNKPYFGESELLLSGYLQKIPHDLLNNPFIFNELITLLNAAFKSIPKYDYYTERKDFGLQIQRNILNFLNGKKPTWFQKLVQTLNLTEEELQFPPQSYHTALLFLFHTGWIDKETYALLSKDVPDKKRLRQASEILQKGLTVNRLTLSQPDSRTPWFEPDINILFSNKEIPPHNKGLLLFNWMKRKLFLSKERFNLATVSLAFLSEQDFCELSLPAQDLPSLLHLLNTTFSFQLVQNKTKGLLQFYENESGKAAFIFKEVMTFFKTDYPKNLKEDWNHFHWILSLFAESPFHPEPSEITFTFLKELILYLLEGENFSLPNSSDTRQFLRVFKEQSQAIKERIKTTENPETISIIPANKRRPLLRFLIEWINMAPLDSKENMPYFLRPNEGSFPPISLLFPKDLLSFFSSPIKTPTEIPTPFLQASLCDISF